MQIPRNCKDFLGCLLLRSNAGKLAFAQNGFYSHCHCLSFDISWSWKWISVFRRDMLSLSSGPFIISVSLAVELRTCCASDIQQCHSEFEPVTCTAQTGNMSVGMTEVVERSSSDQFQIMEPVFYLTMLFVSSRPAR
jgi:hypothetical protein